MFKTTIAALATVVAALLLVFALGWAVEGNEFAMYRFFAPKREAVRRQVFESTKSYNQGAIQELEAMMLQYQTADRAGQQAICSVVRHRTADFPDERIPGHLLAFVNGCR